ncbi:dimethylsulfonioproprionate lyase family protein [Aestuariivirga sp.]|uniref:dimethylsulfonioproprionate lyase family protein n=1 Tax=Aestuariivirga sp. TaxID=2650926 RepID=UPI0039195CEA
MNHDLFHDAGWFLGAARRGLAARRGEGIAEVLERLAAQDVSALAFREPEPRGLPVLVHLPQCLGETMLLDPDLAAAIAAVEEGLQWRQSASYSDAVLGEGFTANYGWAEIIGPHGFFAGEDFLLGLLMLGPHRHYRDHFHPAPELYWPLTSGSLWSRDSGAFVEKPQGATIWHPPMAMHATKTGETPMLALWSWTRDAGTPARLSG